MHASCVRPNWTGRISGKEAQMELRIGLNVLAAVVSFAFLGAIIFGML